MAKKIFQELEAYKMDSARSVEKITRQLHALLDGLKVSEKDRVLITDAFSGKTVLQFILEWSEPGAKYEVRIQKVSTAQKDATNNLAAIHLWLRDRCLNIRKEIETPAEAFGAHLVGELKSLPASWTDHVLAAKLPGLLEHHK